MPLFLVPQPWNCRFVRGVGRLAGFSTDALTDFTYACSAQWGVVTPTYYRETPFFSVRAAKYRDVPRIVAAEVSIEDVIDSDSNAIARCPTFEA